MRKYKYIFIGVFVASCASQKPLDNSHYSDISWMHGHFMHQSQEMQENWIAMPDHSIEHVIFQYDNGEPVIRLKRKIYPDQRGIRMLSTYYHKENSELSSYYLVAADKRSAVFNCLNDQYIKSIRFSLLADSNVSVFLDRKRPFKDSTYLLLFRKQ